MEYRGIDYPVIRAASREGWRGVTIARRRFINVCCLSVRLG
jgi:hypothetical protein